MAISGAARDRQSGFVNTMPDTDIFKPAVPAQFTGLVRVSSAMRMQLMHQADEEREKRSHAEKAASALRAQLSRLRSQIRTLTSDSAPPPDSPPSRSRSG
jgi:hypothetical protein